MFCFKTLHLLPITSIVDNVSVSASGKYIVSNGCWESYVRCTDPSYRGLNGDRSLILYRATGNSIYFFSEYGRPSHFDFAIDDTSADVIVGVSKCGATSQSDSTCNSETGAVIKRRLDNGLVTRLTPSVIGDRGGLASHISTRNTQRPGWAYASYQRAEKTGPGAWGPYFDEVVAIPLNGSQKVERLVRTFNTSGVEAVNNDDFDYWAGTQAVPSPDGRRVLFTSNFGRLNSSGSIGSTGEYVAHPCIDGKRINPY